jgi:hypothetical protein
MAMANRLLPPVLTRRRIWLACAVAVIADTIQLGGSFLGPPGWMLDNGVDLVAMALQTLILGFHPLFFPTFLLKAVPVLDALPTWTGCTFVVIALRRRQQAPAPAPPPPAREVPHDVIDV